jgi:glycosyltransferase involved in cell wall biosynthesis
MAKRRKLLYLAYRFPPLNVSGCIRTWNTARHLARLDWDITVVTLDPSLWRSVERASYVDAELDRLGIRRILTGHNWRFLYNGLRTPTGRIARFAGHVCRGVAAHMKIPADVGWKAAALLACADVRPDDVDVVLASGGPFGSFEVARLLSRRLGCPYVLDYRDLWTTGNPHCQETWLRNRPGCAERRTLADCASAVIVSRSCATVLNAAINLGPKLRVVTNGYDADDLQRTVPHEFGHFAIVYAGTFYPPIRVITPVMAALKQLSTSNASLPPWRFHYYGGNSQHVRDAARQFGVEDHVVVHGQVARPEVLAATKGAGLAVVVTSVAEVGTVAEQGIVTGKIFEPLGLGKPILVVAPPGGDIDDLIETAGLAHRFVSTEIQGMADFLADAMRGILPPPRHPEAYDWFNLSKKFDTILRQAIETRPDTSDAMC